MNPRRELLVAVGFCLLGSALVLVAVSRAWVSAGVAAVAPLPARTFEQVGTQLAPGARALALVGVAAVAALPATRALGRTVVGLLIAADGVGIVAVLVRALLDPTAALARAPIADAHFSDVELGLWPYVGVLGGALLLAAGMLVVVRGRSWVAMSARYDAPTRQPSSREPSLWDSLDRGEDPTTGRPDTGG
ncbi:MAG: Trp biosynthesis-associated membrane protein [Frankiaceae bacterium]|nr:Trp biosynthesis-associated membrane protein [Frankiaceae bacterium]